MKTKIFEQIYKILLNNYQLQGWWPVTEYRSLHPQYSGGPTTDKQILEVIFGAILTQNTSWKNVEKAIVELNKHALIDINKIIAIGPPALAAIIRSSGYHNQKSKTLKEVCRFLKEHSLSELKEKDVSQLRVLLLSVKGIGQETADSIILYAFNKPIFVIDAYTKRIFSRFGLCKHDVSYDELQKMLMDNVFEDEKLFNEYHALLVEHAKQYCRTKPLCQECILNKGCQKKIK
ncbi:hypothetical protein HYY69_01010 [Candidatus Woesearchaeota archaeon]|nr:hypothetical protein [Candidatus Woesearchaeota archaeon]